MNNTHTSCKQYYNTNVSLGKTFNYWAERFWEVISYSEPPKHVLWILATIPPPPPPPQITY